MLPLKVNKEIGFDPRELKCIGKGWIQGAQRLASSHTYSAKFLNLISDFSFLTSQKSLIFRLPSVFVANLYVACLPLLLPWSNFLRATEMLYPRLLILCLMCILVAQSCLAVCNPMDCSLSVSSVRGILQKWTLEWISISFSRGSFQPWYPTLVSHIPGRFFIVWATLEAQDWILNIPTQ